jgi:transcription antitermination factor NusG
MLMGNDEVIDRDINFDRGFADEEPHVVLVCEPQQAVRATVTLQAFRVPYYLPMIKRITTRGLRRTKVTSYRPLLGDYILMPERSIEPLFRLHQRRPLPIHRFLRVGDCLAMVSEQEVRRLRNQEEELARPKPFESIWSVGELARVTEGPFIGFNVTVVDLADGERIRVEIPMFGRAVPMPIDSASLEKL